MKHINLFSTQSEYDNAKLSYPNVSYIEETEKVLLVEKLLPKNNQIFYTTTDGQPISVSDSALVSNVYEDGFGILTYNAELTETPVLRSNTTLSTVILPKSITIYFQYSFDGCTNLKRINSDNDFEFILNDASTEIQDSAFGNCKLLKNITIPNTVAKIKQYAFQYCDSLTNIVIPNGNNEIQYGCFRGCSNLNTITIPNTVTSIGSYAFSSCSKLANIEYNGTKAQFTAITKGGSWKNNVPSSCKVHCTDGDFPITQFA